MSEGDSDTSSLASSVTSCGHCTAVVNDGICCDYCDRWFHFDSMCSGLDVTYKRMMKHDNVLYICNKCKKERPQKNCIENQLNLLSKKVNEIAEKIGNVNANEGETERNKKDRDQEPGVGYANALKKNLLVVKSSRPGTKILEKKNLECFEGNSQGEHVSLILGRKHDI